MRIGKRLFIVAVNTPFAHWFMAWEKQIGKLLVAWGAREWFRSRVAK